MSWYRVALLAACLALSSACGGGDAEPIAPEPGFTLALSPPALAVTQGQSAPLQVTVARSGGFDAPVAIDAVALPAGVTLAPVDVPAGTTSASLTVTLDFDVPVGRLTIPIRARAPGVADRTTSLELEVTAAPPPALQLSFSRALVSGTGGDSLSVQATVERIGRVEGPITVAAISVLPDGLEVPPIELRDGERTGTVRFLTGRNTPDIRLFVVFAASHPSTATVTTQLQLDVRAAPRFLFAFDRTPIIMRGGETRESRLFVERETGGYTGPVTFRLLTPPAGFDVTLVPDSVPDRALITVSAAPTVVPATYMIRTELRGTGSMVDTAGLTIVVQPP